MKTDFGGIIDVLAINKAGDLIVIELKRNQTSRETIAQALDYASWVQNLELQDINEIYSKDGDGEYSNFEEFFRQTFNVDDVIDFNRSHKILIVGSEIDEATIRVVQYLSEDPFNLNINAAAFNYYKDLQGKEFLARAFVVEDKLAEEGKDRKRKRSHSIVTKLFDQDKLPVCLCLLF